MDRVPLFDARSATLHRLTGWERYAGCLAREFCDRKDVEIWSPDASTIRRRLATDVRALSLAQGRVVHFPTFPPQRVGKRDSVVLTVHDLTWWLYPETASRLGRWYYKPALERAVPRAARIVTHSQAVAGEVCDYFGLAEEMVTPVYCGAEFAPSPAHVGASSTTRVRDRPYLLTVGTLEPRKNLERLVEAYVSSDVREELELVIVGRAAWGDRPRGVTVLDDVDDSMLRNLYVNAQAVVLASLYEGFGLPAVEGMALGTPVICSDIPVLREVTMESACYVDPTDVDAIRHALDSACDLESPHESLRAAIRERYSWSGVADRLVSVYEGIR